MRRSGDPHAVGTLPTGLFVEETDGGTVLHHNGGFWGWGALMYSSPDGSRTLTASLTTGDAELDFAATAEAFRKAQQRLVEEVFGSGRGEAADPAAESAR
ncbi:hypothetical protein AB0C76_33260 [Kitasatospora sp. NPDC048722]|uniref:hypothetical protein n=1 Tax=Kitasatospora sp. NPDC048722 TaxID=3155639 RepID=UPI0033E54C7A